jgi:hypothetical protein
VLAEDNRVPVFEVDEQLTLKHEEEFVGRAVLCQWYSPFMTLSRTAESLTVVRAWLNHSPGRPATSEAMSMTAALPYFSSL